MTKNILIILTKQPVKEMQSNYNVLFVISYFNIPENIIFSELTLSSALLFTPLAYSTAYKPKTVV